MGGIRDPDEEIMHEDKIRVRNAEAGDVLQVRYGGFLAACPMLSRQIRQI
jgi:hypothetical protein